MIANRERCVNPIHIHINKKEEVRAQIYQFYFQGLTENHKLKQLIFLEKIFGTAISDIDVRPSKLPQYAMEGLKYCTNDMFGSR